MAGVPGIGYDLLVDEKIRVMVMNGKFDEDAVLKNVDQYQTTHCDIVAREVRGEKMYLAVKGAQVWMTQTEAFGKKKQA